MANYDSPPFTPNNYDRHSMPGIGEQNSLMPQRVYSEFMVNGSRFNNAVGVASMIWDGPSSPPTQVVAGNTTELASANAADLGKGVRVIYLDSSLEMRMGEVTLAGAGVYTTLKNPTTGFPLVDVIRVCWTEMAAVGAPAGGGVLGTNVGDVTVRDTTTTTVVDYLLAGYGKSETCKFCVPRNKIAFIREIGYSVTCPAGNSASFNFIFFRLRANWNRYDGTIQGTLAAPVFHTIASGFMGSSGGNMPFHSKRPFPAGTVLYMQEQAFNVDIPGTAAYMSIELMEAPNTNA